MPTIGETRKKGSQGGNWLHGSDVPAKISQIKFKVATVEEASDNLNCKCVIKLAEPVYDADSWTVNATNLDIIVEKLKLSSDDDFQKLVDKCTGKTFTLSVVMVNNPQTKKPTRSLQVTDIK